MTTIRYAQYAVLAGALALVISLLFGAAAVRWFDRWGFRSREVKEGVAGGKRRDVVPMGGGFILLVSITLSVIVLYTYQQIRLGYVICFLIAFWGLAALGFMDDWSKMRQQGISDRVKMLWQFGVTATFAVCFWLYVRRYVEGSAWGTVTVPFLGEVYLGVLYIPFLMFFLVAVSNSVNFTDGFNGMAGGTAAIVALTYAVLTFSAGGRELGEAGEITRVAERMFALSIMSAAMVGGCLGYLYFNYVKETIIMGDTGSMALGAALAFLAVFSQTEILFLVIGGTFFVDGFSAVLQRGWGFLWERISDPFMLRTLEVWRPFIIAPVHHHFEELYMRELEDREVDFEAERTKLRRRLTYAAWGLSAVCGLLGWLAYVPVGSKPGPPRLFPVTGGMMPDGRYPASCYDLYWTLGILLLLAILAWGVWTRLVRDCYFIAPNEEETAEGAPAGTRLWLYRGVPLCICGRACYQVYEETDIPVSALSYLEQRTGLYRLMNQRIDARIAFGLLHYHHAQQSRGEERRQRLQDALRFWNRIPPARLLVKQRQPILWSKSECERELGQYYEAIRTLDWFPPEEPWGERAAQAIETLQAEAWERAESLYQTVHPWLEKAGALPPEMESTLTETLRLHRELGRIVERRQERTHHLLERIKAQPSTAESEAQRETLEQDAALLEQAQRILQERCARLERKLTQQQYDAA